METRQTGTARKATMTQARRAFAAGATVVVTERPEGAEIPVWTLTTTHNRLSTSFAELRSQVEMWRNRYPAQTYYVVEQP